MATVSVAVLDCWSDIVRYYFEQSGGYELAWVPTVGEALARAHDAFDVILLDIMLPDVDGVKLCASLRKWYSCPPSYS